MRLTTHRLRIALGVLALACPALLVWHFNRPPFDLAKLELLRVGMTAEDVERILERPRGRSTDCWWYGRTLAWPLVYVYFDGNGALASWRYDY